MSPLSGVAIFAVCELGIGLFGLVSEPLIRSVASATVTSPRATVATVNFALLLMPTSLMGATLPLLVTHATLRTGSVGTSIGRLYFANTLGAAVALIYHLSHLDSLHHAVQHMSELRATQQARLK
jgi:hypothetical protein